MLRATLVSECAAVIPMLPTASSSARARFLDSTFGVDARTLDGGIPVVRALTAPSTCTVDDLESAPAAVPMNAPPSAIPDVASASALAF